MQKIAKRTTDLVQRYFGTLEDGQDLMGGAIYEAMVARPNLAVAGGDEQQPQRPRKRCAHLDGFSLHANMAVALQSGADERSESVELQGYSHVDGPAGPWSTRRWDLTAASGWRSSAATD